MGLFLKDTFAANVPWRKIFLSLWVQCIIITFSIILVTAIDLLGNEAAPRWDMQFYLNMATQGISHPNNNIAPFVYRPAAPLSIGYLAMYFHTTPVHMFFICTRIMSVVFVQSCIWFCMSQKMSLRVSLFTAAAIAMFWSHLKFPLFASEAIDIYAFPIIILACSLLLKKRFYACLVVSALGLFFKEFLIIPLIILAMETIVNRYKQPTKFTNFTMWWRLEWIGFFFAVCFVIPRIFIYVFISQQEIDPIHDPSSLKRLISDPLNLSRDANILFSYIAYWLPSILLINRSRWDLVKKELSGIKTFCITYLAINFFLVLYGGTNLTTFVSYLVALHLLVLSRLIAQAKWWEIAGMLCVVFWFNRLWLPIPLPEDNLIMYFEYYGGYHDLVNMHTNQRFTDLISLILGFHAVKAALSFLTSWKRGSSTI